MQKKVHNCESWFPPFNISLLLGEHVHNKKEKSLNYLQIPDFFPLIQYDKGGQNVAILSEGIFDLIYLSLHFFHGFFCLFKTMWFAL